MKIGILTSSRADFGIYLPLLKQFEKDTFFSLQIIAFGTHLSYFHGYTIKEIKDAGFEVPYTVESLLITDSPASVSTSIGLTIIKFSEFWSANQDSFDLVFCLGDRYEMFAAVTAGIPFQVKFAHLHGGETTLGAIDNTFRHSISLAAKLHFVSTEAYKHKVQQLTGDNSIYNVGALSLDNIDSLSIPTVTEFEDRWGINFCKKTILVTFHPETVKYAENEKFAGNLVSAILALKNYQFLITMPNADTGGNIYRKSFANAFAGLSNIYMVENLGSANYFAAMRYCEFLLGNTSSGIIEASSFGKYVINLGDRQKGRASGKNVINIPVDETAIIDTVAEIESLPKLDNNNIYYNGGAAIKIINVLKSPNI